MDHKAKDEQEKRSGSVLFILLSQEALASGVVFQGLNLSAHDT